MGFFIAQIGMLCDLIKACEMNVYEAPKSKRTVVGVEWTSNIPSMTFGSSKVVSTSTWFTLLELDA
jgi:hypothetical protein